MSQSRYPLSISPAQMLVELENAKTVIVKWEAAIKAGIPGYDIPSGPEGVQGYLTMLCGELMFTAQKLDALARTIASEA